MTRADSKALRTSSDAVEAFVEGAVVEKAVAGAPLGAVAAQSAKLVVEDRAAHLALVRILASRNKGR